MPTWVTQTELAKHLCVAKNTVTAWKRTGKLKGLTRDGKVNLEKAIKELPGRVSPKQQQSANIRHGKAQPVRKPSSASDPETAEEIKTYLDESIGDLAQLDIYELQKRNELEKLLMARIKRRKEDGVLVEIEAVKKDVSDVVLTFRSQIVSIPDRLSAILAAETDKNEVKRALKKELDAALNSISKKALVKNE